MKEKYTQYLEFVRRYFSHSGAGSNREISPTRDWVMVFSGSLIACLLLTVFSARLFFTLHATSSGIESPAVSTKMASNRERLANTALSYRQRTERFEAMRATPPIAPNPGVVILDVEPEEQREEATRAQLVP
jgi:hypothetical protein